MHRHRDANGATVQLPVTPLLDVTFQLLFFFVVSFSPADREGHLPVDLPPERAFDGPVVPQLPAGDAADFPIDVTVKVRSHLDGQVSALFVRDVTGKEEPVGVLDGLRRRLVEERAALARQGMVKVEADAALRVRHLTKVMDACRQAGFRRVGLSEAEGVRR
jgi:biopolymer transport protein ExbD